jgi:hypothetical protein
MPTTVIRGGCGGHAVAHRQITIESATGRSPISLQDRDYHGYVD